VSRLTERLRERGAQMTQLKLKLNDAETRGASLNADRARLAHIAQTRKVG